MLDVIKYVCCNLQCAVGQGRVLALWEQLLFDWA